MKDPSLKLSDVGGLTKIKETLISIVDWPLKYPELFSLGKVSSHGILLTGPSGTGKTLMVKALAGETGLNFIPISSSILFSKWLGESEKALHEIFKKAKQSAPTIVFFDEIDALAPRRGAETDTGAVERVASQFFNELDALERSVPGHRHRGDQSRRLARSCPDATGTSRFHPQIPCSR